MAVAQRMAPELGPATSAADIDPLDYRAETLASPLVFFKIEPCRRYEALFRACIKKQAQKTK